MAKKKETPETAKNTTAPAKVTPMELIQATNEKAIDIAKEDLDTYFDAAYIDKVKEQYEAIEITSLKDIKGFKAMQSALKEVKRMRIDTDARRKELTGPALKFRDDLKAHADAYIEKAKQTEDVLSNRIQAIEDLKAAEKIKLTQQRSKMLTDNGFELIGKFFKCGIVDIEAETIGDLSDEDMEHYISMGKQEVARREAEIARKKAEEEKLKKEREEIEQEKAKLRKEKKEYEEFLAWKKSQKEPEPEKKPEEKTEKPAEKKSEPQPEKQPNETGGKKATKKTLSPEADAFIDAKRKIYKSIDSIIVAHLESKTEKITLKSVRSKVEEVKEFIKDLEYKQ